MSTTLRWEKILQTLEEHIEPNSFRTWFSKTSLIEVKDNMVIVRVSNKFAADFLNKNYKTLVEEVISGIYQEKYNIRFTSNSFAPETSHLYEKSQQPSAPKKTIYPNRLNSKYKFEAFVVGKSNNFAHSAALAVADSPGTSYNPLFLYGESGMGKTHLMQAIGNYLDLDKKDKQIFYTTTEEFTNEMIEAIQTNRMPQFRAKYRNMDLLLIDDIHFLAGKERTQEEFFHTFNALYENKIQIVMTSDRPPKDIQDLEKRLVTRFEWGLLADLKTPDFETRVAILNKKAEYENIVLSQDVIGFIAEHIYNNVRSLEGSLIRILAYASYNNLDTSEITVSLAREILNDMVSDRITEINMDTILTKVCEAYNITPGQLLARTRKRNIVFPRQIAMYLSNLLIPQLSLKEVALFFRRKDHTTVLHAKKQIEAQFREDNDLRIQIEKIIKEIKGQH